MAAGGAGCGTAAAGSHVGAYSADGQSGDGASSVDSQGADSASAPLGSDAGANADVANPDATASQADADALAGGPDADAGAAKDTSVDALAPTALPVMVYGVVTAQKCGSKEAFDSYTTVLVDPADVSKALTNLKTELTAQNPGKFVKTASSKFEYGPTARHMCALKWTLTSSGCAYDIFIVEFGKTEQEALDLAIKRMKLYAPKNAPYVIVEQKAW